MRKYFNSSVLILMMVAFSFANSTPSYANSPFLGDSIKEESKASTTPTTSDLKVTDEDATPSNNTTGLGNTSGVNVNNTNKEEEYVPKVEQVEDTSVSQSQDKSTKKADESNVTAVEKRKATCYDSPVLFETQDMYFTKPGKYTIKVTKKVEVPVEEEPESKVETPGYTPSDKGGNGSKTISALDDSWTVVNTETSPEKYAEMLQDRGVCQNSDTSKYGDKCLGFSDTHAWGLFTGNNSYTADDGCNYAGAANFKMYSNENKQSVLKVIYEEIKAGRPCILHVNGNKAGTSRHFVTVVGFREGCHPDTMTEDDLLIIDSWDAKLERMDQSNSRFMTTGKDCGKSDYTGWRVDIMR